MRFGLLGLVLVLLAGCSASDRLGHDRSGAANSAIAAVDIMSDASADQVSQSCASVESHATTVGKDFTRSLADEAIVHRIADARGQLIQKGVRRVKIAERMTNCEEHLYLGPGLQEYHCKAEARLCGQGGS